jgi:hypothetical protein
VPEEPASIARNNDVPPGTLEATRASATSIRRSATVVHP